MWFAIAFHMRQFPIRSNMQLGYMELELGNALDRVKYHVFDINFPPDSLLEFVCTSQNLKVGTHCPWYHHYGMFCALLGRVHIAPTCTSLSSCHLSCCVASMKVLSFNLLNLKVFRCYSNDFLNRMHTFGECVTRWGSKNKHCKDTRLKENELCFQSSWTIPHSTVKKNGRIYVFE